MQNSQQSIAKLVSQKHIRLRTWAVNKGLAQKDISLLMKLSNGTTKGIRKGRTRELLLMLKEDGLIT